VSARYAFVSYMTSLKYFEVSTAESTLFPLVKWEQEGTEGPMQTDNRHIPQMCRTHLRVQSTLKRMRLFHARETLPNFLRNKIPPVLKEGKHNRHYTRSQSARFNYEKRRIDSRINCLKKIAVLSNYSRIMSETCSCLGVHWTR